MDLCVALVGETANTGWHGHESWTTLSARQPTARIAADQARSGPGGMCALSPRCPASLIWFVAISCVACTDS